MTHPSSREPGALAETRVPVSVPGKSVMGLPMLHSFRVALGAACALMATTAGAMADATTDDARCLVVYMRIGASDVPQTQLAGMLGTLYYMGKLDGRTPGLDIENTVLAELPKMTADVFRTEAGRCGKEMQARGAAESAMGQDLERRAQKMEQDKTPH
jgi:hypothetical protein